MNLNFFARRSSPSAPFGTAASTGALKPRLKGVLLSAALLSTALMVMTSPFMTLAEVCATPGKDGSTFNPNSYYPAAAGTTAAIGSTTVTLGTKRTDFGASSNLAVGDLVLIVQMQDALINNSDSVSYGDGSTGRGYTGLRSTGYYEFNVVSGISGTTLTLQNPLAQTYTNADASTLTGQRRFQVVRVPQFSTLTLSSNISVPAWNGDSGGVFALNVAGNLNLNGYTIDASNAGFRGGGSVLDGDNSGNKIIDYATPYTTTRTNYGAFKGEGIAGTPRFVRDQTKTAVAYTGVDLGTSGYPTGTVDLDPTTGVANVTAGLDRSRGAPGNAGGGGDQHNAGGGGGSNVGAGGLGGNSFAFYRNPASGTCVNFGGTFNACDGDGARPVGGLGGVGISPASVYPNAERLIVGGGGGAGDNNNASDNSTTPQGSGGNGGGVIFVVANTITGSGILRANGQDAQPAGRDAAGGGGAGGTVAIATNTNSLSGLSIQVNGGSGGNSGLPYRAGETQGPGGGGGGGAVLLTTNVTTPPVVSFTGGAAGVNSPAANVTNVYGGAAGAGGKGDIVYNNNAIPRTPFCFPQLTVTKVTTTPQPLNTPSSTQTPSYKITISNAANVGAAAGVQVADTLPTPFTYAGPTAYTPSSASVTRPTSSDPAASATTLNWSSFVIPGGQSVTLDFPINRLQAVGTFQNSASVSFLDPTDSSGTRLVSPAAAALGGANTTYTGGGTVAGSNYASASSTAEDIAIQSDLQVTKQAFKTGTIIPQTTRTNGQSFDYLITVTNLKAVNATGVTVTDTNFPANVTLGTPVITPAGSATITGTVLTVPALAAGQSVSVRLPVTVNTAAASLTPNMAALTASTPVDDGTNGSVTTNNTQTVSTYFNPVQLKKYVRNVTASEATDPNRTTTIAKPSDKLEYCVQATSLLTTALDVNVSDALQPNQTFVTGSITNNSGASPVGAFDAPSKTVTGTLKSVSSTQTRTLCFQTTVN